MNYRRHTTLLLHVIVNHQQRAFNWWKGKRRKRRQTHRKSFSLNKSTATRNYDTQEKHFSTINDCARTRLIKGMSANENFLISLIRFFCAEFFFTIQRWMVWSLSSFWCDDVMQMRWFFCDIKKWFFRPREMRYDDNGMEDFLLISCGQQPKIIKTRVRRVFRWEWICMDDITHESFPSVFAVAIQTQSCFIN